MKRKMRLWVAILYSLSCTAVLADEADEAPVRFSIDRYQVNGNHLLGEQEIRQLLSPHTGSQRDFGDIMRALETLEAAYQSRGYRMVRIDLPEQDLTEGVVKLDVVEAKIGRVTVEGNQQFDEPNIRRSLPGLKEGSVPNLDAISRSLKLANENPAKKVVMAMKATDSDDVVDARLSVSEESVLRTTINVANSGSNQTGRTYAGVVLQNANLFGRDHVASLQYTTTIEHPNKVSVYGLGYRLPLYASGDAIDVFYTYSDVNAGTVTAGALNLNVSGKGHVFGSRYNFTLPASASYRSKLVFGIDYKAYDNSVLLEGADLANDITVHPLSASYEGNWALAAGTAAITATVLHNVPGGPKGGATDFSDARSGANADYTLARFTGGIQHQLGNSWQLNLMLNGQYTRDALIPGEQFGAGGATSVRGFEERKTSNDSGLSGNLELYTPAWSAGGELNARMLAFVDAARLWRNKALAGEAIHTSISSAGVGVRLQASKRWAVQMDYGHVLQDGGLSGVGTDRVHVRANLFF